MIGRAGSDPLVGWRAGKGQGAAKGTEEAQLTLRKWEMFSRDLGLLQLGREDVEDGRGPVGGAGGENLGLVRIIILI